MPITNERIQELLNLSSGVESRTFEGEALREYREILELAKYRLETKGRLLSLTDENSHLKEKIESNTLLLKRCLNAMEWQYGGEPCDLEGSIQAVKLYLEDKTDE